MVLLSWYCYKNNNKKKHPTPHPKKKKKEKKRKRKECTYHWYAPPSIPGIDVGEKRIMLKVLWKFLMNSTHISLSHTVHNTEIPLQGYGVVSEPDPRKIEKEGLAHRLGWKCTLRPVWRRTSDWLLISILMCIHWNTNGTRTVFAFCFIYNAVNTKRGR